MRVLYTEVLAQEVQRALATVRQLRHVSRLRIVRSVPCIAEEDASLIKLATDTALQAFPVPYSNIT